MKNTSDMPILVLHGDARSRGRIHGESLRPLIHDHIGRMKNFIGEVMKANPDNAAEQFIAETNFLPAIRKWTPDLLEEMEGIAEGAGQDFNAIYLLNLGDECWWFFYEKQGVFQNPTVGAESCSSMGVESDGRMPALIAQNLDMPDYYDGLQALLHIKDSVSEVETLAFSFAGVIGVIGVNDHGLGMCDNTLLDLKHSPNGLPVMHVSRGIMAQPTLEDAVAFVHRVKHASGQNYIIGSPDGVVDYECSASKVRRFLPQEAGRLVYHTNHALVNDDKYFLKDAPKNSQSRFASVEKDLLAAGGEVSLEVIRRALSSHTGQPDEVCVHPSETKRGITANCVIFELSDRPRVHYTAGPPCESEFLTFRF